MEPPPPPPPKPAAPGLKEKSQTEERISASYWSSVESSGWLKVIAGRSPRELILVSTMFTVPRLVAYPSSEPCTGCAAAEVITSLSSDMAGGFRSTIWYESRGRSTCHTFTRRSQALTKVSQSLPADTELMWYAWP